MNQKCYNRIFWASFLLGILFFILMIVYLIIDDITENYNIIYIEIFFILCMLNFGIAYIPAKLQENERINNIAIVL